MGTGFCRTNGLGVKTIKNAELEWGHILAPVLLSAAHAHSCAEGYENESLTPKTTGRIQKKCL